MAGLGPTWVLKVNLHYSSNDWSDQVKKHLKKIQGVTRVHINIQEGLVTVSGVADASILIEAIKNAGLKAKLWKFERDPKHKEERYPKHQEERYPKHQKERYVSSDDEDVHARHYNGYGGVRDSAAMLANHPHQFPMQGGYGGVRDSAAMLGNHPHQFPMQGGYAGNFSLPVAPYPYATPYSYEAIHPTVYGGPHAPDPYYYQHQPTIYTRHRSFRNSLVHYLREDDGIGCTIS